MVKCEDPIPLYREALSDPSEPFRIHFELMKLQNHCKKCLRMTHDTRGCTSRGLRSPHPSEHQPRRETEKDRKRHRGDGEEQPKLRDAQAGGRIKPLEKASVSIQSLKPLQRNLLSELGEVCDRGEAKRGSTKEWVRKAFDCNEGRREGKEVSDEPTKRGEPAKPAPTEERGGPSWYFATEEAVDVARDVFAQHRKWEQAEIPQIQPAAANPVLQTAELRRPARRASR